MRHSCQFWSYNIFLVSSLFLLFGCQQISFLYTVTEPIRLEPMEENLAKPQFEGEGTGNLWSDCREVNQKAIDQMLGQARARGFAFVADLEWFDYEQESWTKEPTCKTEFGWLAGMVYTFWWPNATKIRVRARGMSVPAGIESTTIFSHKQIGTPKQVSEQLRKRQTNTKTASVEIMSGPITGIGLSLGSFVDSDTRWSGVAAIGGMLGYLSGCGPHFQSVGQVTLRREKFLGNSLFYSLGPAIQNQLYFHNCPAGSEDAIDRFPGTKRWHYGLVGADFGIGNEWSSESGLFGGCEWLGAFVGARAWTRGDEPKDKSGQTMPLPVIPRALTCRFGSTF